VVVSEHSFGVPVLVPVRASPVPSFVRGSFLENSFALPLVYLCVSASARQSRAQCKKERKQTTQGRDGRTQCCAMEFPWSTWSTWSAVISLTSRAGELRSAPSGPDDWHRVAGKRALALGGARSQGHNTGLRGLAPRTGFPLNCRTPPLLGASDTRILSEG